MGEALISSGMWFALGANAPGDSGAKFDVRIRIAPTSDNLGDFNDSETG